MRMKFVIEQRHLTDPAGKPLVNTAEAVSFHTCEAATVDDALRVFATDHEAEVIGNVLKFPGSHAVATMRSNNGVFTLQVSPSSQSRMPAL